MNGELKVAFATSDLREVDQHFGAAESIALHAVSKDDSRLIEVVQFGRLAMDGSEDKLAAKVEALDGCVAVYANAMGASAVAQLRQLGVQPIKVEPGSSVAQLIRDLQEELRTGPVAWLARAVERQSEAAGKDRFEAMEAEGWDE